MYFWQLRESYLRFRKHNYQVCQYYHFGLQKSTKLQGYRSLNFLIVFFLKTSPLYGHGDIKTKAIHCLPNFHSTEDDPPSLCSGSWPHVRRWRGGSAGLTASDWVALGPDATLCDGKQEGWIWLDSWLPVPQFPPLQSGYNNRIYPTGIL